MQQESAGTSNPIILLTFFVCTLFEFAFSSKRKIPTCDIKMYLRGTYIEKRGHLVPAPQDSSFNNRSSDSYFSVWYNAGEEQDALPVHFAQIKIIKS